MKRLIAILGVCAMLTGAFFLSTSCEKDTRKYELTVVITANDSVRVQNASVRIYAPVANSIVDYFFNTDENGEVNFTFEDKVIVEIEAVKGGSYRGCTFAELNRGENTVYLDLKRYDDPHSNGC